MGIENVRVIHLNDSKNLRGSHKDRHENIGYGAIGFDTLYRIAHEPLFRHVPKILETPYVGDFAPYGVEIEALRVGHAPHLPKEEK